MSKDQTRRAFLKSTGFGISSLALTGRTSAREATAKRPNILWITCEDISPNLGCYGDAQATTPALDRLANEGVRYTNAYSISGVCAPSRSCLITGMYPTTLGSQHMRCTAVLPPHIKCFPEFLREAGYYCTNSYKTDYQFKYPPSTWDESGRQAHWRNCPNPEQPFFAVFNFICCHESRIESDERYAEAIQGLPLDSLHDPEAMTLPPYYPDTPKTRRDWARYLDVITAMDRRVAGLLAELEADGLDDSTIVFFYSDHGAGLPRAKRWLYDSGLRVPLMVRIPEALRSAGQGEPGTTDDELVSFVDMAPTVLNLAGVTVPSHMQGRAYLGTDRSSPRRYVYGARDRMDERYDVIRAVRDKRYKYIRNYEPYKPYYQYMNTPEKGVTMSEIRRVHAEGNLPPAAELFMAETKPLEELYDLRSDPHEIDNLASSVEHERILSRMRTAHVEWVKRTNDLGFIPEAELSALVKKHGSGYAIARGAQGEGLIERALEAARLPEKGVDGLPELIHAMSDKAAAVRYWGAIGIGNLGVAAAPAESALLNSLDDSSANVRIAVARALCGMNRPAAAFPVLRKALKDSDAWARLHGALVLDEIGEQARPLVPELQDAMEDEVKYVVRVANHALNCLLGRSNRVP